MPDAMKPRTVKARKRHACYWCGQAILPGEEYIHWAWFDRGRVDAVQVHPECWEAWNRLAPLDPYVADEVGFADFSRGCTCGWGQCVCGKTAEMKR